MLMIQRLPIEKALERLSVFRLQELFVILNPHTLSYYSLAKSVEVGR
jgi:hypothetical protein